MPRTLQESTIFKKDRKRIQGSGRYNWQKIRDVVNDLMNDIPLPPARLDHPLKGVWLGARECHIEADWLLIYKKDGNSQNGILTVIRTGSHSDLF